MAQYGLTVADIGGKAAPKGKSGGGTARWPAKYRNPSTGDSWSGRGLQPRWLKAALASGKKLSDFVI
jgi:DNA-binding protein H-NS